MRTITDPPYNQSPTPAQAYSASVPLSVYRELAAELQAAQVAMHQLNLQNEHLAQENYVLRQEIAKTVNAVLHLQNAVNSSANVAQNSNYHSSFNQTPVEANQRYPQQNTQQNTQSQRQVPPKRAKRPRTSKPPQVTEYIEPFPEPIYIEEEEASYYYADESESQVRGWWLIFAIVFIIVMGFGAGYVVVRPLLENHSR